jgi:uncharacterized DUF497 family protein
VRFEWDDRKNETNLKKHGVRFETATAAFHDPWFLMEKDRTEDSEDRWRTLGEVNWRYLLLVVDQNDEEVVRIITARDATPQERRRYERSL